MEYSRRSIVLSEPQSSAEIVPESGAIQNIAAVPGFLTPNDIDEAFAQFLHLSIADGSATADTIVAYRRTVKEWYHWCAAQGIRPENATRSYIELYRNGLKLKGQSVATRAHKLSIIRRFYDALVEYGFITTNPAAKVRGGKDLTPPEEKMKHLSEENLGALFNSLPRATLTDLRARAIIGLMSVHGMRRVEVQRLNHEDITDEGAAGKGAAGKLIADGKGNKKRTLFLRHDTHEALREYHQAKFRAGLPTTGAFFVSHANNGRGTRLSRFSFNNIVDKCLSDSGIKRKGVSCHALRHTHGTLAVAGGAPLEHLKEEMGHTLLSTSGIYVRAVNRRKYNPANYIAPRLDEEYVKDES